MVVAVYDVRGRVSVIFMFSFAALGSRSGFNLVLLLYLKLAQRASSISVIS